MGADKLLIILFSIFELRTYGALQQGALSWFRGLLSLVKMTQKEGKGILWDNIQIVRNGHATTSSCKMQIEDGQSLERIERKIEA